MNESQESPGVGTNCLTVSFTDYQTIGLTPAKPEYHVKNKDSNADKNLKFQGRASLRRRQPAGPERAKEAKPNEAPLVGFNDRVQNPQGFYEALSISADA